MVSEVKCKWRENGDHENKEKKVFPECNDKLSWCYWENKLAKKKCVGSMLRHLDPKG